MKKARLGERVTAIHVVREGIKMTIVGTKKKMQVKDQRDEKTKEKVEEPEKRFYL